LAPNRQLGHDKRAEGRARLTPAPLPQAPLNAAQRLACLSLIRSDNVGPVTFRELINHFGGAEPALEALPELSRRGGRQSIRICPEGRAQAELEAADRIGAQPLFTIEPGYPPALAALEAPPPLLYVKGNTLHLVRPMVAIVGARNGSAAGQKLARMFASRLGSEEYISPPGLRAASTQRLTRPRLSMEPSPCWRAASTISIRRRTHGCSARSASVVA
jgi:DNA processing protein